MQATKTGWRHEQAACFPRRPRWLLAAGLALLITSVPNARAQNLNDLLRIIIPPLTQQRPTPPPVYVPPPTHTPAPQPYPQQRAPAPAPTLSRVEIQQTQQMLNDMGYDTGVPDGSAGPKTIAALNAFQRDNGLPVTARVDKSTAATLAAIHRHTGGTAVTTAPAPAQSMPSAQEIRPVSVSSDTATTERIPLATDATKSVGLRKLATPPPGIQPITFNYFKGVPIWPDTWQRNAFELMSFAHEAPKLAKGEPSALKKQECSLISRYFTEQAKQAYISKGLSDSKCFQGNNEFETQDSYRNFYAQNLELLKSSAPSAPFRIALIHRVSLDQYDAAKAQFTFNKSLSWAFDYGFRDTSRNGGLQPVLAGLWPKPTLPITADAARQLLEKIASFTYPKTRGDPVTNTRDLNVVAVLDILGVDYDARRINTQLVSVGLYGPDLDKPIHDYTLPPDFGAFVRGEIPARLKIPSPVALDEIFVLAQRVSHPANHDADTQKYWESLFGQLKQRDVQFYANPPEKALSNDDSRLPVFPRDSSQYDTAHQPKIERWVAAYLAGLPDEVELGLDIYPDTNSKAAVTTLRAFGGRRLPQNTFDKAIDANHLRQDQIAYASRYNIDLLLTGPDQLDLYTLEVPSTTLSASKTRMRQKSVFRLESIKPITRDNGQAGFLIELEPLHMRLENQQGVLAQRDFADVKKLAGVFAQTSAPPTPPRHDGPLALSPAVLDMLVFKALGDQLPEAAASAAALRRWRFEQAPTAPFGGAFYIKGRRAPEPQDLPKVASQFKAWTAAALADAPWQLKVALDGSSWREMRCTAAAANLGNSSRLPQRNQAATKIRQASDAAENTQRNTIIREQRSESLRVRPERAGSRYLTKDERMQQLKRLQMLDFAIGVSDRYIEIGEACGLNGYVPDHPELAALYLHLQDGVPPPSKQGGKTFKAEVTLDITAARIVPREPHYTDLLPPDFVDRHKLSRSDRDHQAIILEATLKEIVYFSVDRNRTTEIGRQPPDPRLSIQSLTAAAQAVPALDDDYRVPAGPYGQDIVGVQLGMPFDEAEAIIRKHMDVGQVLEGRRASDTGQQSGLPTPMTAGKLFVSRDQRELIALIDEPPLAAGKVLGVWRQIYMAINTTPKDVISTALLEKYGDPTNQARQSLPLRWYTQGASCDFSAPERPISEAWTDHGKPADLKQQDGKPMMEARLPGPYFNPFNPHYEQQNASLCGPVLTADVRPYPAPNPASIRDKTVPVDWLVEQTLTDIGAYTQAYQANHDAAYGRIQATQKSARPMF
ncbi:peptidoglycan-binding domain-containing protein [Castellaniella caeni]|uniref:peptidoglycan-binding domain-containing protein n=1 Tax=Castellaniella caeni TaxID=266123 RepID=UPI0009FF315C|nr:peptidoglycan-binding domain-containing protein [Castellaniella caeni]